MSNNDIISPPQLPQSIQGDGRVLMSLLNRYLNNIADAINVINDVDAPENVPSNSIIATPQQFIMVSDRVGSIFRWNKVVDDNLDRYELRSSNNTENYSNIIDITTDNKSIKLPIERGGVVYLFAKTKDNKYSNPNPLNYTKGFPNAPSNVAISKTQEGTVVYFATIPDNCIGANIYINQAKYFTQDNVFLCKDAVVISEFSICYIDSFGEGHHTYSYLTPGVVENFSAIRNGEYIDFSWNGINLYNIQYEIRRGISWDIAEKVYSDYANTYKFFFPNSGLHVFWIKSLDEYGNYSADATFYVLNSDPITNKNIIASIDQKAKGWPGAKLNMVTDIYSGGLELRKDTMRGEHFVEIELPKKYSARNWIDYKFIGVIDSPTTWDQANFSWDSIEAQASWIGSLSSSGVSISHQIAKYIGLPQSTIEYYSLDETTVGTKGTQAKEGINITYEAGRFKSGVKITDLTKLSWDVSLPQTYSIRFNSMIKQKPVDSVVYATLTMNNNSFIYIGYSRHTMAFFIADSGGVIEYLPLDFRDNDCVSVGLVQTATTRKLYITSFITKDVKSSITPIAPIGAPNCLYLYPKLSGAPSPIDTSLHHANAVISDVIITQGDLTLEQFALTTSSPIEYEGFRNFVAGEYEYEKALVRVILEASVADNMIPQITDWVFNVDIQDVIDKGMITLQPNIIKTVSFGRKFYHPPEINLTLKGGTNFSAMPQIIGPIREDGFDILLVDGGIISWTAIGY